MFKKLHTLISSSKLEEGKSPLPLRICIAQTMPDLESAFKLLFQTRSEKEWTQYDFRGMRVNPMHLLPSTTMIIAKAALLVEGQMKEMVVGTLTIVKEGPFGFLEMKGETKSFGRCGELVECATAPELTTHSLYIKEQLRGYAAGYALNFMKLDTLLIHEKTMVVYKQKQLSELMAVLAPQTEVRWPERQFQKSLDPVLDASSMNYFFGTRSSIFNSFTLQQKVRALLLFRGGPYFEQVRRILNIENAPEFSIQRGSSRFESLLQGKVIGAQGKSFEVMITQVSRKGLALILPTMVDQDFFRSITDVQAQLKEDMWCCLKVKPVSFQNFRGNDRGFEIIDADKVWFNFIYYLTVDYFPEEARGAA